MMNKKTMENMSIMISLQSRSHSTMSDKKHFLVRNIPSRDSVQVDEEEGNKPATVMNSIGDDNRQYH